MCLTSQIREPQDVMSTDDPSVESGTPNSKLQPESSSPSSPVLPPPKNVMLDSSTPHVVTTKKISTDKESDISLSVSESTESELNMKMRSEDTISISSEGGELKKENAQSAFAFISVIEGDDEELENSTVNPRQPVSSLDESIQMKHSESEEDSTSLSEDHRLSAVSTDQDQEQVSTPVESEPVTTTDSQPTSISQTQPITSSSTLSSSSSTDITKGAPSQQQAGGPVFATTAAAPGNGPSVSGPSRFRRVNHYNRGRWKVRETEATEERLDSDQAPKIQVPNSSAFSSPSTKRRSEDGGLHSRSASELGQFSDNVSDKDSTSVPLDRSSTAAEGTLSRNTSMSSIMAEKSIDGDDRLGELADVEVPSSIVGGPSGKEKETLEAAPSSSQSSTNIGGESELGGLEQRTASQSMHQSNGPMMEPVSESESSERQQAVRDSSNPSFDKAKLDPQKIHTAMSFLQSELNSLLSSNTDVEKKNKELQVKNDELEKEIQKLRDENSRLKRELEQLKTAKEKR